jgi:hypothetical protein
MPAITARRSPRRPGAIPAEAGETSAPSDDSPPVRSHDDVHPVPAKPRALVEAVLRAARQPDLADQIENRPLGRRAAGRKTEQHRLADVLVAKATHLPWHANVER